MSKIIGNPTITPMAIPDWNQNDSSKADYIKNKPSILAEEDIINLIAENGGGSSGGSTVEIIDNLTSTDVNKALSANMGNQLKLRDERLKYYGDLDIIPTDSSYFSFTTNDITMTAQITRCVNSINGDVVIPYKYTTNEKEYKVTGIGELAIGGNNLSSVIIPNSIIKIEKDNFYSSPNLINIIIPNSVKSIGVRVFGGCSEELIIKCDEGSVADIYAQENGINVEYTDEVTKQFVLDNSGTNIEIVDNLISTDTDKALSANMGRKLNEEITSARNSMDTLYPTVLQHENDNDRHITADERAAWNAKADESYVDEKIGDIETALDNIIAIQNELIGGESI